MKITPVNFATYLEPELINFWKDRVDARDGQLKLTRSHNFKISKTSISVVQSTDDQLKTHCMIDLLDIPQKEDFPAINCLLHTPNTPSPQQLLMIFKKTEEASFWCKKILSTLDQILSKASQDDQEPPTTDKTSEEDGTTGEEAD